MDVFGFAVTAAGDGLRDAAIDAGYELGAFDGIARTSDELADANGITRGRRRMRPLLDLLVALDAIAFDGTRYVRANPPQRPTVMRAGWGTMVEVFRRDKALDVEGGEVEHRYQHHLAEVGAAPAAELAKLLGGTNLIDLGSGVGTYTAAYLDRFPDARATAVDFFDIVPLTRNFLGRFGERATILSDEISTVQGTDVYDIALLSNVVHLHDAKTCEKLIARATRLLVPGGRLVIKDLRHGPLASLMFALNMAIYTGGGDVYRTPQITEWMRAANLTAIAEHRLDSSPDSLVLVGEKPRGAAKIFTAVTGLEPSEGLPEAMPAAPRMFASHAMSAAPELAETIRVHYAIEMPRQRKAQLANSGDPLLHHPLSWHRMPRMRAAIERLFGVLHEANVTTGVLGFATPKALFGEAASLARLYERTHYGGAMPLLYGTPADLAYIATKSRDRDELIDRYLVAPVLHELCHFSPDRDALPPHLDECIGGWLAVYVWPEFAYPSAGCDDAIYAAPWLAQVGQAFARAFGISTIVRAQSGAIPWDTALSPALVEELSRCAWNDWTTRRSLHFLADTLDPDPWVALALDRPLPEDAAFDRAIVGDALRAMCVETENISGSLRTRTRVGEAAISIDAVSCQIATAPHNALDSVAPRYWLPPAVAGAIRARGHAGYDLFLGSALAIPNVVATLCDGAPAEDFTLVPHAISDTGH
jgi:hypothetical protein